ncbi:MULTISPECIES: HIT family protein [Legionella]|uniref:HIT domain-containing protein n=1 Tax=Legionella septentrionalis TaxID=2498109 RepID=A0A3S0X444_9GAMM|nr:MULTISPECIES: HIT domain-containing protein [Legionella]MCP0913214.1 HIT domain-containing protein [Legionella sp. 27cVA30]RUQ88029.1 HIT domain-containing protein [Legionella septentrionalis]RUR02408.1 HIT domain-containing protein [Legionella septentrionalis]RUR10352.1 HIT domain-containing protein [Legionella septentrionalis]RUR17066.1 HIT domain-containing protein [Legionella septentrionalis]
MKFTIDPRILCSSFELGDWPLSSILLKDNVNFPWLILVPRVKAIQEIWQLSASQRHTLMDELHAASTIVQDVFKPNKLNIGSLGNIVSQLHVHVIGRFINDDLWPHGVWQAAQTVVAYPETTRGQIIDELRIRVAQAFILR